MTFDRVAIVEEALDTYLLQRTPVAALLEPGDPLRPGTRLTAG